jgi:1-acyl-sn-glycerol-3-phosphate acyltransferase
MAAEMIRLLRSIVRSLHLILLLLAATVDGKIRRPKVGAEGAVWVHRWCRRIVRAMGLRCTVSGPVLMYAATTPCIMVSKTEVRSWPLIGWITAQAGTVYVQRADVAGGQTQTHGEVNAWMAEAFRSGLPVLFYPEGTTTDGLNGVQPFRRGLFHSVLADRIPVRTSAVSYRFDEPNPDASVADDVCFWGDADFVPHLFRLLGLRGVHTQIEFGERVVEGSDRFALAANAHDAVAELYDGLRHGMQVGLAQPREHLLDRPVEGLGTLHDEVGVGG